MDTKSPNFAAPVMDLRVEGSDVAPKYTTMFDSSRELARGLEIKVFEAPQEWIDRMFGKM